MSTPTRFTGGLTQSDEFQPLGQIGMPDPFYYAVLADDFLPFRAGDYTITAAGGSVAATGDAGHGGRILLTTGDEEDDFAAIQQPTANFGNVPGKKLAFLTRVNLDDVEDSALIAGLIDTTATPFEPAHGVYFSKAAGDTAITLTVESNTVEIPAIPNNGFLNGSDMDLGFVVTEKGDVEAFVGYHLVGYKPNQNNTLLGPVARIYADELVEPLTLLPVNPTVALAAGTDAEQTGSVDFIYAAQER